MTTSTKQAPKQEAPSALEVEAQCLEEERRGQTARGQAVRDASQAESELREARKARESARDAQIRGEDGADQRLAAALERKGFTPLARSETLRVSNWRQRAGS